MPQACTADTVTTCVVWATTDCTQPARPVQLQAVMRTQRRAMRRLQAARRELHLEVFVGDFQAQIVLLDAVKLTKDVVFLRALLLHLHVHRNTCG